VVIAILGAGYIGTALCAELTAAGHSVTLFSREALTNNFGQAAHIQGDALVGFAEHLGEKAYDAICFCICPISPGKPFESGPSEQFYRDAFRRLAKFVKHRTSSHFIYFSSGGAIYGDIPKGRAHESTSCRPIDPYGMLKLSEEAFLDCLFEDDKRRLLKIRPSNPYSRAQSSKSGVGFVAACIECATHGRPINILGDGFNTRDYIRLADLVTTCSALIMGRSHGTFNVGSAAGFTQLEVVEMVGEVLGTALQVKHSPAREGDVRRIVLNVDKLLRETSCKPMMSLRDGIQELLR